MESLISLTVFVFGLLVGSFLNVVIFRLKTGEDMVNARSKCMACDHQLAWYDLFPVFSFLFLKGKCRYCKEKISWQYPLVEIATGIAFAAVFFQKFQDGGFNLFASADFLFSIFIFSALVVIFVFDLKHYIIPDKVIYPAIAVAFLLLLLNTFLLQDGLNIDLFWNHMIAAFISGGFFLFLVIATKGEGMGGGDVKLGVLMGLVLGFFQTLLALFIAFVSGAAAGILLILLQKKKMKSMLPFGPFLILGFLISYFWGGEILGWYWNMFLL